MNWMLLRMSQHNCQQIEIQQSHAKKVVFVGIQNLFTYIEQWKYYEEIFG